MSRASFSQVNLVSGDPGETLRFYRLLGVDLPPERVYAEGGHFHADAVPTPGTLPRFEIDSVTFASHWNQAWRNRADLAAKILIGFDVAERAEVDSAYQDLVAAGFPGLHPPEDAFWGSRFAIVEDPDGVAVGIMSPPSDSHRSPRPPP